MRYAEIFINVSFLFRKRTLERRRCGSVPFGPAQFWLARESVPTRDREIRQSIFTYLRFYVDTRESKKSLTTICICMFQLDILVNNAGRSQRAQWENIEMTVDKEMFELNVFSIVSLSRLAVKHFLQTGKGQIVINSSVAGFLPVARSGTYCGAKHALHVNTFKPYTIILLTECNN